MRGSLVALTGGAALVVAACGGSGASDSASSSTSVDAGTIESSLPLEPVLVSTASGGEMDFNSLRGQDVLLWFWAPW